MLDQLQHLGRLRGCTHLVLEVAENNKVALGWYRKRHFQKLDAAIFMAQKLMAEPELLPPRKLAARRPRKQAEPAEPTAAPGPPSAAPARKAPRRPARKNRGGSRKPKLVPSPSDEVEPAPTTKPA